MSFPTGTRLGPYEIKGLVGAGGMGQVYRAWDPRLRREVAIKVLPPEFSQDRDRLSRFEQEARTAASLNHPNIAAIHDVGVHSGVRYLVSELLPGESLRERLRGGSLPPKQAIEWALEIARGLTAAHEKGIVHRDLKPENVFITRDGRAKILDFGIAKLAQPAAQPAETENLSTIFYTGPGSVVGTPAYMSPEQIRGQPTDARTDVFSLGVVLFEMLSGKSPFHRHSGVETMNAILKEDPPKLQEITNCPASLQRVVRHCLEKDPAQRFQSVKDLAFDLESFAELSVAVPVLRPNRIRPLPHLLLLAVLVGLTALAGTYFLGKKNANSAPLPSFHRLSFQRGYVSEARFAPGGRNVIYSAMLGGKKKDEILSTSITSPESRSLGLHDSVLNAVSISGELAFQTAPRTTDAAPSSGCLNPEEHLAPSWKTPCGPIGLRMEKTLRW